VINLRGLWIAVLSLVWTQFANAQVARGNNPPDLAQADVYNFDGEKLPAGWKILNEDRDRWTMQPKRKSILIETQTTSCSPKDGKNLLVLDKPLPTGDFEVTVKGQFMLQRAGNQIAVYLYKDDANYFWIPLDHDGYHQYVYFQKYFGGAKTGDFSKGVDGHWNALLRIVRDGNFYTGSYVMDPENPQDLDKAQWVSLGTLPWIGLQGQLMLCAHNYKDAAGVAAEFFTVTVRRK
jgi:hypothetical protein